MAETGANDLLDRAIEFAALRHDGQLRKGTGTPYLSHPYAVGMLLAQAGCADELIAAGVLHDTIEDTGATVEELTALFGESVAAVVWGCTEKDKSLPWETRKERALAALAKASADVRVVQCADKLHNARSMLRDHQAISDQLWSRFKRGRQSQAWFYGRFLQTLAPPHASEPEAALFSQLARIVASLFGS